MKSEKIKLNIDIPNECVIDFYRLIDTIDINQIRFTDFYRLTTPDKLQLVAHKPITTLRRLLTNVMDKDKPGDRQGAVIQIKCCTDCQATYTSLWVKPAETLASD